MSQNVSCLQAINNHTTGSPATMVTTDGDNDNDNEGVGAQEDSPSNDYNDREHWQ